MDKQQKDLKNASFDTPPPKKSSPHPAEDQLVGFEKEQYESLYGRPDALPNFQNPLNYPPLELEDEE